MDRSALSVGTSPPPAARDVLALLKPITWFPPMWAFAVGVVSSGTSVDGRWLLVACGVLLAGPMVCGTSQAINDWFDRHVDAINEPDRPIPSGRVGGRWGLYIAILGTLLSLLLALALGPLVLGAAAIGLALAWAYSAPPFRLKVIRQARRDAPLKEEFLRVWINTIQGCKFNWEKGRCLLP